MNNVNIDGISNINTVTELFASVNGLSNDNCFLIVTNRDYGTVSSVGNTINNGTSNIGSKIGGTAGGIIGGVVGSSITASVEQAEYEFRSKLNDKQRIVFAQSIYGGYLLNITPEGIGIIPLNNGNGMLVNVKKFVTDIEHYVFFSNDEIEKIEIQKLPLRFSTKRLAIYFKGLGDFSTPWALPKKHKLISYQKENFKKLANKLK